MKQSLTLFNVRFPKSPGMPRFLLAIVILVAAALVKWHSNLMPIDPYVPDPPLPSPDARQYFDHAEAMLTASITTAAPLGTTRAELFTGYPPDRMVTLSHADALVQENQPAFTMMETGLRHPYFDQQARSFEVLCPYFNKDRELVRALNFAGRDRAVHGDWGGAMNYYLDALQMGADLPRGSLLIGMLVGAGLEANGRKDVYAAIDHLTEAQSNSAVQRLAGIDSSRQAPFLAMVEEKWWGQASLLQMFRQADWRSKLAESLEIDQSYPFTFVQNLEFHCDSPRTVYDNYSYYMDSAIARDRLPWPEQQAARRLSVPNDPFNKLVLPIFQDPVLFRHYEETALDRLLEVHVALHAYRLEHTGYPRDLEQLVPEYLSHFPTDPFTDGAALKYRLAGSSFVLYSVGPDMTDNGGHAMFNSVNSKYPYSLNPENPYWILSPYESGDIVEGINR